MTPNTGRIIIMDEINEPSVDLDNEYSPEEELHDHVTEYWV